jgi:hypothetical protein
MTKLTTLEPYQLLLSGMVAIALLTTGGIVGASKKMGRNVLKPRQFICQQITHQSPAEQTWTVMYRGVEPSQPWLRIIPGMEGEDTLEQRCEEVALKLDVYLPEQLETILYRANPETPQRSAICLYTAERRDENDCKNLLILKLTTSPADFFQRMTVDLQDKAAVHYSAGQGTTASYTAQNDSPAPQDKIDLRKHLAKPEL